MMQVSPAVVVMMMVHVPVSEVYISNMALPVVDKPRARGDSLYLLLSTLSSDARSPHCMAADCAGATAMNNSAATIRNFLMCLSSVTVSDSRLLVLASGLVWAVCLFTHSHGPLVIYGTRLSTLRCAL